MSKLIIIKEFEKSICKIKRSYIMVGIDYILINFFRHKTPKSLFINRVYDPFPTEIRKLCQVVNQHLEQCLKGDFSFQQKSN